MRWQLLPLVVGAGLVAIGVLALWAFPALVLPRPTGPATVGTTVVQWTDGDRPVVAQLWYPAKPGGRRATYLGRDRGEARVVAKGLASTFGAPSFLLSEARRARSNGGWNQPAADGDERWPVVLFSPGLSGVRTQNTAWAEELASHGYVVVGLDHVRDSAVVVLDDGTAIRTEVRATGVDEEDERLASEWTTARAGDLRFVRTRLAGELPLGLGRRLDLDRVAVSGHSLGGAAAIQAASDDPGFAAVIDLDGFPRNLEDAGTIDAPVLLVVAARGTGNPENDREYADERRRVLESTRGGGYELIVPGTAHLSFTDAPLFLPPVPSLVGSGRRRHGPELTARVTLAFLEATLGTGDPADLERDLRREGLLDVARSGR